MPPLYSEDQNSFSSQSVSSHQTKTQVNYLDLVVINPNPNFESTNNVMPENDIQSVRVSESSLEIESGASSPALNS